MPSVDQHASYLVECYWPGVTEAALGIVTSRARQAALRLRQQGHRLEFLGSILVLSDETVFCLFDGIEADVRAASEEAGIPFERVLESVRLDGGTDRASTTDGVGRDW